jgi:hypothetical protein
VELKGGALERALEMKTISKAHIDYWKQRLRKRGTSPNWNVPIQFAGIRKELSLATPNRETAAAKARDIYLSLLAHGWEVTLAKYRPAATKETHTGAITVGDFLKEAAAKADARPETINYYSQCFRKIVSDIFALDSPKKHDHRWGGRSAWLARINAVPLAELSPGRVQAWKRAFVARAQGDPIKERYARNSVNGFILNAKALFSQRHIRHFSFSLPHPLPFDGIELEPRPSARYRSTFDVEKLIAYAGNELAVARVEVFKIFLLALMAGLRRLEIDLLEWTSFRWQQGVIRVEPTRWFEPKSEHSIGDIAVDAELLELFRGYRARATGQFVIESEGIPRRVSYQYYRCEKEFQLLTGWLRAKGVDFPRPLHTLRKEFGSQICLHHGIYAASSALRHGALRVTTEHYVESRVHAISGLGRLLQPPDNITPITLAQPRFAEKKRRSDD